MASVTDRRRAARVGNQRSGGVLGQLTDPAYREEVFYPALLDLGYDLAPGTGEVRSGLRADAAFGRAGQQIEQGQYLPAAGSLAEGTAEYLGAIPALGFAASLPGDTARFLKRIMPKPEKFSKVRGGQYQDMTGVENMMESGPEMEFGTVVPSANIDVTQKDPLNTMRVEEGILDVDPRPNTKATRDEFGPQLWQSNLFRQVKNRKRKDGSSYQTRLWSWVDKPEGVIDNAPVVSLHKGSDHVYVLDATYDNPTVLDRSDQARLAMERGTKIEEPSMKPKTRGSLYLGNKVGTIKTPQGIRDVYDQAAIAKPGQENFKGLTPAPKDFFKKSEARAEKVEPMPTVDKGLIGPDIPYSKPGTLTTGEITPEAVLAVAGGKKKKGTKTNPFGENYGSELNPDGTYKDLASFEARYAANPPRSLYESYESKPSISGDEFPNLERNIAAKGAKPRTADAVNNQDLRQKLIEKAMEGQKIMGGKRWYPTNELYQYYVEELGEEAGKAKFIRDMHIQAAASTNTKMQDLPKVAAWYQYQAAQGMPITPPVAGSGVGHKYSASSHAPAVKEYLETGQLDHLANPKRSTFVQNLLGREDQVTIDKHNVRAIGMLSGDPRFLKTKVEISDTQAQKYRDMGIDVSVRDKVHGKTGEIEKIYEFRPQDAAKKGLLPMEDAQQTPILWVEAADKNNEYKYLEEMQQSIAKELNMTPAEFQENLWIGAGQMTGLGSPPERAIDTIEKRVRYTAERLGADPEEVMRAYVRGDIPLAQRQDMMQQYGGLLG